MASSVEHQLVRVVGALLAVAAVSFAWLRSEGFDVAIANDTITAAAPARHEWRAKGDELWEARCAGCHAELADVPRLFLAEGGRRYLLDFMLFGARGKARIDGETKSLRHRPYGDLGDAELAAVLNLMLVAWGNDATLPDDVAFYTAAEVEAARPRAIAQDDVLESRPALGE